MIAAAFFAGSAIFYALSGGIDPIAEPIGSVHLTMFGLDMPGAAMTDLGALFIQPDVNALRLLLLTVCGAMLIYGAATLRDLSRANPAQATPDAITAGFLPPSSTGPLPPPRQMAMSQKVDHAPQEMVPLIVALVCAGLWPWIAQDNATAGFVVALTMMIGGLTACLRGQRLGWQLRRPAAISLFAGWATAVAYASFAGLLSERIALPQPMTAVVALLLCAATGIAVQFRLGHHIAYSVALIWALIGIAAATMGEQPQIATAAIVAVAAMAGILVRSAS